MFNLVVDGVESSVIFRIGRQSLTPNIKHLTV